MLHVASPAKPVDPEGQPVTGYDLATESKLSFKSPSGMSMATDRPLLKAAMQVLGNNYPATLPFDVLRRQARELLGGDTGGPEQAADDTVTIAVGLLNCYMGSDLVELHGMPVTIVRQPGDRPVATPLARVQAARGAMVTNRRHEVVRLNDLDRQLVPLLDGTNDRGAIADKLTVVAQSGGLSIQKDNQKLEDPAQIRAALGSVLEQALGNVAKMALLVQ